MGDDSPPRQSRCLVRGRTSLSEATQRDPVIKHTSQSTQFAIAIFTVNHCSKWAGAGLYELPPKMTPWSISLAHPPSPSIPPRRRGLQPVAASPEQSVFEHSIRASSRAGILAVSDKLKSSRVAIVGLRNRSRPRSWRPRRYEKFTYSMPTPSQHNAFRAPSAASLDDWTRGLSKVAYSALYSRCAAASSRTRSTSEKTSKYFSV